MCTKSYSRKLSKEFRVDKTSIKEKRKRERVVKDRRRRAEDQRDWRIGKVDCCSIGQSRTTTIALASLVVRGWRDVSSA